MKKVLLMLALMIGAVTMMAQEDRDKSVGIETTTIPILNELALTDSLLLDVNAWLEHIEINLSLKNRYKLYPTDNMYTFLRLNTRTGQIKIVQWSTEQSKRFIYTLDNEIRISSWQEDICGRFILQKTDNIYNFILLDQIDGRCWQVQWNFDRDKCMVLRIW